MLLKKPNGCKNTQNTEKKNMEFFKLINYKLADMQLLPPLFYYGHLEHHACCCRLKVTL